MAETLNWVSPEYTSGASALNKPRLYRRVCKILSLFKPYLCDASPKPYTKLYLSQQLFVELQHSGYYTTFPYQCL
jgi:hypothetical protein